MKKIDATDDAWRLEWDEWIVCYGVEHEQDSGGYKTPIDIGFDDERVALYPDHIWTKLGMDDWCCDDFPDCHCPDDAIPADVVNGAHRVNRMEYYFSKKPFDQQQYLEVY